MKKIVLFFLALIFYNNRLSAQCNIELLTIPPVSVRDTQTVCISSPIDTIYYKIHLSAGNFDKNNLTVTNLPQGVDTLIREDTLIICGIPSQANTFNYIVTYKTNPGNGSCNNNNCCLATGTIIVRINTAGNSSSTPILCIGEPLMDITHTTTGATGISNAGISGANGLPPGVSATWTNNTITISGTPQIANTYNYSIPLIGGCGSGNVFATGTIIVTANGTIILSSASATISQTLCINTAINNITYTTTGATGATVSGLPRGVFHFWENETLTIIGTPDTAGIFNYTITLPGSCGNATTAGTIRVNSNYSITLVSGANVQTVCNNNTAISPIEYAVHGATGANYVGLPNGVSGFLRLEPTDTTFLISGTPVDSGTYNYTVTFTGGCGNDTASGTIIVKLSPTAIATPASQTMCSDSSIVPIVFSGNLTNTVYHWTKISSATSGTIGNSGMGNISGTLINDTTVAITDIFRITPKYTYPGLTCEGNTIEATVVVNPIPDALRTSPLSQIKCSGNPIDMIKPLGDVPGTVYHWRRNNTAALTGIGGSGTGNIDGTLTNNTNLPIKDTFNIVPAYSNAGLTCTGDTTYASVLVNPLPTQPFFKSLSLYSNADILELCQGSTNINFNVSIQDPGIVSYLWSPTPTSTNNITIRDTNDANTVISFTVADETVRLEATDTNGCKNSISQTVKVNPPDGIKEQRIFLKQPGNILIYPDNSLDSGRGYQWGYDDTLRTSPNKAYSAPIPIPGQVYQSFIPESRFIKNGQLDTVARAFWVLLKKDSCISRVYYNGPYATGRTASSPAEINTYHLKVFPNPNNGVFHIALTGNIYGNMHAVIYNTVGQPLFTHNFTKRVPELYEQFNTGSLPAGLYFLEIKSSDLKKVQTRFIIKH